MIPNELEKKIIKLPDTDNHNIVIVTGNGLRHKRFAYRIQQEFGNLVSAWYELDPNVNPPKKIKSSEKTISKSDKILGVANKFFSKIKEKGFVETTKKTTREVLTWYHVRKYYKSNIESEKKLFQKEIEEIKPNAQLESIKINPKFVHEDDFINQIKDLNPYFFLTLGGPLYKKDLLQTIRGAAINQHAGHSPDLKGSQTIEWALYHRNLSRVSSTVHITVTGADAGPILRRSSPCIYYKDNVPTIFARVVALGTEMMIEALHDIISNKDVAVYEQPINFGKTYLSKEYNKDIIPFILKDFNNNWLELALFKQRSF